MNEIFFFHFFILLKVLSPLQFHKDEAFLNAARACPFESEYASIGCTSIVLCDVADGVGSVASSFLCWSGRNNQN